MGFRQPRFVLYQADGNASICLPLRGVGTRNTASFSFKMHSWCLYFGWALLVGRLIAVLAALRKTGSRCNQYDHPTSVGDSRAQRRVIHQCSSRPWVHLDHTALHRLLRMCINKKVVLISCSSSEVYSILFSSLSAIKRYLNNALSAQSKADSVIVCLRNSKHS